MIEDILKNSSVEEYLVDFRSGETLCREGEDSQDLFILVDGEVEILKGMKPISETGEKGAIFGEISFILESKRTASVRARSHVKAIRIPKDKIDDFFIKFPILARHLLRLLARRLDARTQSLFAFKEFCDQLPDAVVATDDHIAFGVLDALGERGLDDVAVVGFNNTLRGRYQSPALTSVDVNPSELGAEAAALLIDTVRGVEGLPDHRIVKTMLIERESSAAGTEA